MDLKKDIGSFVFRNEGDGCLTAKYLGIGPDGPYTESAVLSFRGSKNLSNDFDGVYHASWLEGNNVSVESVLTISKNEQHPNLYDLKWVTTTDSITYKGEGMIFEKLLVGHYWLK